MTASIQSRETNTNKETCQTSRQVPPCPENLSRAIDEINRIVWQKDGREPLNPVILSQLITTFGIESCWHQAHCLNARLYHATKAVANPVALFVGSVRGNYSLPKALPEHHSAGGQVQDDVEPWMPGDPIPDLTLEAVAWFEVHASEVNLETQQPAWCELSDELKATIPLHIVTEIEMQFRPF